MINFFGMRISYRSNATAAIYDPILAHILLLLFASIFAPFFGLGWILGAYIAGRYLLWRHSEVRRPWLMMVAYILLVAVVYEVMFAYTLWA